MNWYFTFKKAAGPYLLGVILAIGATVAWAAAVMLASSPLSMFASYAPVREYVQITLDGEALLVTAEVTLLPVASKHYMPDGKVRVTSSNQRFTYRTLDGQPVEIPMAFHGYSSLIPATEPRRLPGAGPQLRGFLSSGQRAAYWYAVFRDDPAGHAYFVGFDPYTRLPFGYLATAGFRVDRPAASEQFRVDAMAPGGGSATEPSSNPSGMQFLVSEGRLYAIDFDEQSLELLSLPARVVAVGTSQIPLFPEEAKDVHYERMIVVRLPEELIVLRSDATEWRRVPIPPPARDRPLMLYGTLKEQVILEAYDEGYSPREMYWIDADGTVARQASAALPGSSPRNTATEDWMLAAIFPEPWIWGLVAVGIIPTAGPTTLSDWLPAGPVCLVSALLAILCYRRQRSFSHPGAAIWAVLVFVLGPPGFIGYLAHRRWPPKERCGNCGAIVPRDRPACAACAVEFPPPEMRGIEVFA